MKSTLNKIVEFIFYFLIYFSCYFNIPNLCSLLIRLSLLKKRGFKNKLRKKKLIIVLNRSIGNREVEIIRKSANKKFDFLYFRRSITKTILARFLKKKKLFFNYSKPNLKKEDYFNQNKNDQKQHEKFWSDVIFDLKNHFNDKIINFVTFNYSYYAEAALYAGCNRNNIPVKLWYKEGIKTDLEAQQDAIVSKYNHMFKYFSNISVYNKLVKKMLITMDKSNSKKITINGCPRIYDYINDKKYYKKIKNILFLSFDSKRGIPKYKKNKDLTWNLTYDRVIHVLNELSNNKNLEIIIKRKNNSTYKSPTKINKRIKIFEKGTAEKFINRADIIIGHNSASTIEALINGKYVMIPFFEKKSSLKKYLYNFNKEIVFTKPSKLKKSILKLVNKRVYFPLSNKHHNKTIQYYLGSPKNITENYIKFLNS